MAKVCMWSGVRCGRVRQVRLNAHQTMALDAGGGDLTPALDLAAWTDQRVVQRKIPRQQVVDGLDSMSAYLSRLELELTAPAVDLTHMHLTAIPPQVPIMS